MWQIRFLLIIVINKNSSLVNRVNGISPHFFVKNHIETFLFTLRECIHIFDVDSYSKKHLESGWDMIDLDTMVSIYINTTLLS